VKFKIDENLPDLAAEAFRRAGHDADTVREEQLLGSDDSTIARVAREEKRAIVALDRHFANERAYPPSDYNGLIVIRGERASCGFAV
jgi:predicted nuclease of predicted toxin-antitoxin system